MADRTKDSFGRKEKAEREREGKTGMEEKTSSHVFRGK